MYMHITGDLQRFGPGDITMIRDTTEQSTQTYYSSDTSSDSGVDPPPEDVPAPAFAALRRLGK